MKAFEIIGDYESPHFVRGAWLKDETASGAHEPGVWAPDLDLEFDEAGRVLPADRERLRTYLYGVRVEPVPELDVVGVFDSNLRELVLVSDPIRAALSAAGGPALDEVAPLTVWDQVQGCAVAQGPFTAVNIVPQIDGWNPEKTAIATLTRADGSLVEVLRPGRRKRMLRADAIVGAALWRDARTRTPLCSETVKAALEAQGLRGWKFVEVPVE